MKKLLCISLIFVSLMIGCGTENTPVYNLSITVSPQEGGSVATNPNQDVATKGTAFTSTATPNYGYSFVGWKGDITSTENPLKFNLESNTSVIAEFALKTYPLNITIVGNGNVTEQIIQNKATDYEHGTNVQIQAIPDDGWSFVGWTGDITATMDTKTLTINSEKNITANFEPEFYLAENGITVMCPNAETNETGVINGIEYTKRTWGQIKNLVKDDPSIVETTCTSDIADMSEFYPFLNGYSSWSDGTYTLGSIEHWDVSSVSTMSLMFYNSKNFNQDLSNWDTSSLTNMHRMFRNSEFNGIIESWDVSNITNMVKLFDGATEFNRDLDSWDVSNVTNMNSMFNYAENFNGNIENWDVSNVTDMNAMFNAAHSFNGNIGNWDVSSVTKMSQMFSGRDGGAKLGSFNQNIDSWNTSMVTDMSNMFYKSVFNQPINNWDVSSVTNMYVMFASNPNFNQDLSSWDVSSVTDMYRMFHRAESFNQDLSDWCVSNFNSEPFEFSTNSPLASENKPKWGTCPGG